MTRANSQVAELRRFQSMDQEISILRKENKQLKRTSVSLAHDLKNHIQALLWTIESSDDTVKKGKVYNRLLDQTIAMKDTISMIMESSTTYSRRSFAEPLSVITETAQPWKDKLQLKVTLGGELRYQKVETGILRQIMLNLFSNSIKHSGKDPVTVFIEIQSLHKKISFNYADDGIGLSECIIHNLNQRKPAVNPGIESGTGLWLIHELVRESGGTLSFLNGKFHFELPAFR